MMPLLDVSVGYIVAPDSYWIAPLHPTPWIKKMEESLTFSAPGLPVPSLSYLTPDRLVLARNAQGVWKRAKVLKTAQFNEGVRANMMRVDEGEETGWVDVAKNVRKMPHWVEKAGPPQAVSFKIKGLIPVQRSLRVEFLVSTDRFQPMVSERWSESAHRMVVTLLSCAERAAVARDPDDRGENGVSGKLYLYLRKDCRLGEFRKWVEPGERVNVGKVLERSEHCVFEGAKLKGLEERKVVQHKFSIRDVKTSYVEEKDLNPWEAKCGNAKTEGNIVSVEKWRENARAIQKMKEANARRLEELVRPVRERVQRQQEAGTYECRDEEENVSVWDTYRRKARSKRQEKLKNMDCVMRPG